MPSEAVCPAETDGRPGGPPDYAVETRVPDDSALASHLAQVLAERALTIYDAACGPGHPRVAASWRHVTLILRDLGETADAQRPTVRAPAMPPSR